MGFWLYSVCWSLAGELCKLERNYRHVEKTLYLTTLLYRLRVAQEGYTIQYDPEA
jgi:hypothetical protein